MRGGLIVRTGIQSSGGSPTGVDCSGTFSFDMGAHIACQVDGSPYTGPARFRFDRLDDTGQRQLAQLLFERAPYVAVALSPASTR